ncbi:hypothetical protein [Nonomuraea sp. CA-141351]|uniref:hypothetical protein n=1 Tax=Nonomuraea sp. CA-141351 TaxID=3239996 RepID=UPI003D93CEF2
MLSADDVLSLAGLIVIAVSAKPIVDRMVLIAESDPALMCAACQIRRRSYPLLAAALMPRCYIPACSQGRKGLRP